MGNSDIKYIFEWFIFFFIIGITFLPLTFSIFNNFKDKGYIFSKILGLIFVSYLIFILGTTHILKFSQLNIIICSVFLLLINYSIFKKINIKDIFKKSWRIFIAEELIFLITLVFWVYIRSNLPDIHGLEKFMDFGFVNSILRADYFPPKDMWYTPLSINYYYFGHLVTAVVIKLTNIPSFIGYNLMLSTLFALAFTASLSIGINIFDNEKFSVKSMIAGIMSSVLVTLGGNLTTIYTFFKAYVPADKPVPFWQLPFLPMSFPNGYWYPNATRFIPYTIHEFPLYSFVVSDLHGHVLDIPFVLLNLAIVLSFLLNRKINLLRIVFLSFLFAVMYMTNAWDGLIYLLLSVLLLGFLTFNKNGNDWKFSYVQIYSFFKGIITFIIGFLFFSLPFSVHFKPFVSGIGIVCAPAFLTKIGKLGPFLFEVNHCQRSPIWQLIILYGFFYFFVISFIIFLKFKKKYLFSRRDIFVLLLIILSTILIIVPEFIYIKDIYPLHYRANTMFKLVYEAFIMLSISSGYILIKLISNIKNKKILTLFLFFSVMLISLVLIYPVFAINSYYRDLKTYMGLDGLVYLKTTYPSDYGLINWVNKNIKGQPVILEANGDSYTDYARISSNTGLPTVIGWPVHEWLWRGSWDVAAPRITEVETMYTSNDLNTVKNLIQKYNISYIVVSMLETQKYPKLNEKIFIKLGKIIYNQNGAKLYKIY